MSNTNNDSNFLAKLFNQNFSVKQPTYDELYRFDGLVTKIVNLYPDTAYATGFEIESPDVAYYKVATDRLQVYEKFRLASKWARLHGLSAILLISPGRLDKPFNGNLQGLKVFALDNHIDTDSETIRIGDSDVHRTRLIYFYGVSIIESKMGEVVTKSASVLDGVIECLTTYRTIHGSIAKLLSTSNQLVIGTAGLGAGIRSDILTNSNTQRDTILSRLNSIQTGRNLASIVMYDKDNEEITNVSNSLSDVDTLAETLMTLLAQRTDYPKNVLFGETTKAGIGSGQAAQLIERMIWAQKVTVWIENNWLHGLQTILDTIQSDNTLANYEVKIPLSLTMSEIERAQTLLAKAKALTEIGKVYPVSPQTVENYLQNDIEFLDTISKPDTKVETIVSDSIIDDLTKLSDISDNDIDEIMSKVANA